MARNGAVYIWGVGLLLSTLCFFAGVKEGVFFSLALTAVGIIITAVIFIVFIRQNARFTEFVVNALTNYDTEALRETPFVHISKEFFQNRQLYTVMTKGLAALPLPVVIISEKGRLLEGSDTLFSLLGKKRSTVLGKSAVDVFSGDILVSKGITQALSGRHSSEVCSSCFGKKDNSTFLFQAIPVSSGGIIACWNENIDDTAEQSACESQQLSLMQQGEQITALAQRVASASEELSASADEQAGGASRQSEQALTVASSMEEMTATVLDVAHNASSTSEVAAEAQVAARDGVLLVSQAVEGIKRVSASAGKLSVSLGHLNEQAGEIGRIIGVINDIADQTNLLALNAAIEAARAGEAGRGFAVVADEVRKLAEKTMSATKEVENAINTIQSRSGEAMHSMQETEEQVVDSTERSVSVGDALQKIMEHIEDMVQRVSQIATAAEEQSSSTEAITLSVEEITRIAKESEEGAEQAAMATRDLAELSQNLLKVSMVFSHSRS